MMLRGNNGFGYVRLDWFTPDGLGTWGDGRLFILGTEGYIEVRKYTNVARQQAGQQSVCRRPEAGPLHRLQQCAAALRAAVRQRHREPHAHRAGSDAVSAGGGACRSRRRRTPRGLTWIGRASIVTTHERRAMKRSRARTFIKASVAGGRRSGLPDDCARSRLRATAPSNRINIGAIGVGRISRGHDMPGVLQFTGVRRDNRIIAVCDLDATPR